MEFKNYDKVLISPKLEWVSPSHIQEMCPLVGRSKSDDFVRMNNEIYHRKCKMTKFLLNELVGEIISEYFELQTKKSLVVVSEERVNDFSSIIPMDFSLLAKSFFEKDLEYCRFNEFSLYYGTNSCLKNLSGIGKFFSVITGNAEPIDKEDYNRLICDLKKMIVRDFLTKQSDRSIANFMFGYKDNHIKLMPLYDYEHSFTAFSLLYGNVFDLDLHLKTNVNIIKNDLYFQELLYKLTDFDFEYVITKLEAEYGIYLNNAEQSDYTKIVNNQKGLILEKKILK